MTVAIVYSFAVEPDLPPVVGAPSYGVLARQIPRLAVGALNAAQDHGVRFFPLLGPMQGRRQFFMIPELLVPEQLAELHGQPASVRVLVDGRIEAGGLRLRMHEAPSLRELFDEVLPLDPCDPRPVVSRLMYELSGVLELPGALPRLPGFEPPALSYFLVAKDDLLSLEAGFEREGGGHWLQAITTLMTTGLDQPECRQLLIDIGSRLARDAGARDEVGALLEAALEGGPPDPDPRFLADAATLLEGVGRPAAAAGVLERLLATPPTSEAVALRLSLLLFNQGRHVAGRDYLEAAVAAGLGGPRVLAQLMVFCQRSGAADRRRALALDLAARPDLPTNVARMLCADLTELDEGELAVAVGRRAVAAEAADPGLWLELGRALMRVGEQAEARTALATAHAASTDPTFQREVARLQRYVDDPGMLGELGAIDADLAREDLAAALRRAEALTQRRPDLAEGWLFLGIVQQRREAVDAALAAFGRALEVDATLGEAHNRAGILHLGRGDHEAGFEHLGHAVRLLPNDSGAWVHFAQACALLDKLDEGREALKNAARLGASGATLASVARAFFPENG